MPEKIYLIFTTEGFDQAKPMLLESNTSLWCNPNILSNQDISSLKSKNVTITILTSAIKTNDNEAILTQITQIETEYPDAEILVEYL